MATGLNVLTQQKYNNKARVLSLRRSQVSDCLAVCLYLISTYLHGGVSDQSLRSESLALRGGNCLLGAAPHGPGPVTEPDEVFEPFEELRVLKIF